MNGWIILDRLLLAIFWIGVIVYFYVVAKFLRRWCFWLRLRNAKNDNAHNKTNAQQSPQNPLRPMESGNNSDKDTKKNE
jgi:hypothetical protein